MNNLFDHKGSVLVYAWGQGLRQGSFGRSAILWTPRPVSAFDATGNEAMGIAASNRRMIVWTSTGDTFIWRQLDGKANNDNATWVRSPGIINHDGESLLAATASITDQFALVSACEEGAPQEDESLYAWGSNAHGQLGIGDNMQRDMTAVQALVVCLVVAYLSLVLPAGPRWGAHRAGGDRRR